MVEVEVHDRLAEAPSAELLALYGDVYGGAPYWDGPSDVAEFAGEWGRLRGEPGIRLVVARVEGRAVGLGLGHVVQPGSGWWGGAVNGGGLSFGIAEFGVAAGWRGLGIARRMHDALLMGRREESVVLWVRADAPIARAVYDNWGYRVVGSVDRPPLYFVMCLDLVGWERMGHG